MHLTLCNQLTKDQLGKLEFLIAHRHFNIYWLNDDEPLFLAELNNQICALFEFAEYNDGLILAHAHVLPDYRGKGIGKEIMRQTVNIIGSFHLPSRDSDGKFYYIENGLQFIRSCFNDGILSSPNFIHPDSDDLNFLDD